MLLKAVVGLVITAALVWFLAGFVEPEQLRHMVQETCLDLCLVGLALWVLLYAARTVRFKLLAPKTPWLSMFCISALHNFFLRLLPLRTGDISWAFLIRRAGAAGLGESLLNLVLVRILDMLCVLVIFCLALAADLASAEGVYAGDRTSGLMLAGAASAVVLVIVLLLRRFFSLMFNIGNRLLELLGLQKKPTVARLWANVEQAVDSFTSVRPGVVWLATLASLANWVVMYAIFGVLLHAFGMPVNVSQTVLGATGGVVSGFLPIGGIGSFGTLEAGWTFGFVMVGLTRSQAVTSGFGVSVITFGYSVLLAAVTWPLLNWLARRGEDSKPPE